MSYKLLSRVYFSTGALSYNDEVISKSVTISFEKRELFQRIFVSLIVLAFLIISTYELPFEVFAKLSTSIYLLIDLILLGRNVKLSAIDNNLPFFESFKISELAFKARIGALNLMCFSFLFLR